MFVCMGWPSCRAECSRRQVQASVGVEGQPSHAVKRAKNCLRSLYRKGPRQFVVALLQSARPNRFSRGDVSYRTERVARWPPTGDRKAIGSGAKSHANWRGSVCFSTVCGIVGHIYGIYDPNMPLDM